MFRTLFGAALLAAALTSTQAAQADEPLSDPDYTRGVSEYSSGMYTEAAADLTKFICKHKEDGYARYYMANTLAHQNHMKQAIEQYRFAYWLCPDQKIHGYCQQILGIVSGAPVANSAADITKRNEVVGLINSQADAANANDMKNVGRAQSSASNVSHAAAAMDAEAEAFVNNSRHYGRRGTSAPDGVIEWANYERMQASLMRASAARWGADQQELYLMRSHALSDTAQSIQHQITDDAGKTGFKMIPQGTSLYVQNFSAPQEPPLNQLIATPKSLASQDAASARAGRLSVPVSSERKLQGVLMDSRHKVSVSD